MSIMNEAQCREGDSGLYLGLRSDDCRKQEGPRDEPNARYNPQLMPEHEHQAMKMSLEGKLLSK